MTAVPTAAKIILSQKREKRTGFKYEYYQPRPMDVRASGDCVIRAMSWCIPEMSYKVIHAELQKMTDSKFPRSGKNILFHGVNMTVIKAFMGRHGWVWHPAKHQQVKESVKRGSWTYTKTKTKRKLFKAENLPRKLCMAITTRHAVAVDDHVVLDSYDSRGDRSCWLEGYFLKA